MILAPVHFCVGVLDVDIKFNEVKEASCKQISSHRHVLILSNQIHLNGIGLRAFERVNHYFKELLRMLDVLFGAASKLITVHKSPFLNMSIPVY